MPPHVRAELVGGVVRIVSPLSYDHSKVDSDISDWLGRYVWRTPGLRKGMDATVKLARDDEVQPDCLVRIVEGGRSRIAGAFIEDAPELMVEVARSSLPRDLGEKRLAYERAGVLEYLIAAVDHDEVTWLTLRDGEFAPIVRDDDGLHRSSAFPGLCLDADALFRGDLDALFAALDRGLATPEHAEFVARLAAR
jgi:Uma2 family endonuclease